MLLRFVIVDFLYIKRDWDLPFQDVDVKMGVRI